MNWMQKCYSRLLIDNHITDQRPEYMSHFSPEEYVAMVALSGVESAMVYACDHNGNCYYPAKVGHRHGNMPPGRDFFGEVVGLLRRRKIVPVAYYSLVYHNDAARRFPQDRALTVCGKPVPGRYLHCCPNAPEAIDFCREQLSEILTYDIDGIFLDMTFWPTVCCCPHCRRQYREQTGREIPTVIDWNDPKWVSFQRFREESLVRLARTMTDFIHATKPGCTVTHQFSPVLHGWFLGQSSGIALASDYASGDFYGDKLQQRFALKVFDAYSTQKPFEYMTSRCESLRDHTSGKSPETLFIHALTTLAHGGAYFFIDAINPDGTLEEKFYRSLHRINEKLSAFRTTIEQHRPQLYGEVGLYFSMTSCIDPGQNNRTLEELDAKGANMDLRTNPVRDEAMAIGEILSGMHIAYRVLTDQTSDWRDLKAVIVPNAAYLRKAECERIRLFARQGGTVIATAFTSRFDQNGIAQENFGLSDLFGIDYAGTGDVVNYLAWNGEYYFNDTASPLAHAHDDCGVLGRVSFPFDPANDPEHYASIHSNPPGPTTEYAGLTEHAYGKGRGIWLYSSLLQLRQASQRGMGITLFEKYLPRFLETDLPFGTEVTLLRSTTNPDVVLLCAVNAQAELPNLPVFDRKIEWESANFTVRAVTRASDGEAVPFTFENHRLVLPIARLDDGEFFILKGE
ncbi:MAG: beta-galactosidase trimerization domain-containing protein [Victivallaceae bacterium]|nr:beta-galactosidase trimerization domain-containing protein [Victivallaceae bacterium]